jgi:hypothetical protein
MHTDRIALVLLGIGTSMALWGCPGTLDNKAEFLADGGKTGTATGTGTGSGDPCGDVPTDLLAAKCGTSACHGSSNPQVGLDLESPDVAARVVGVSAKMCPGVLANPGNVTASVLYTKLLANVSCGGRMPLGLPSLTQMETECLKSWIAEQGAGTSTGAGGAGGAGGGT